MRCRGAIRTDEARSADHRYRRPDTDALVKIDDVLILHADAAVGHEPAD